MKLSSFWLRVILFFMACAVLFFVVVSIKTGKQDAWNWSLEFLAGLLANIVAALIFLLWFEPESETKLKQLLDRLKQSGSRVIPRRARLGPEIYEEHIETSDGVEILGIACKSVLRGIFPDYQKENEQFEIGNCHNSILYKRLMAEGTAFSANIYFLSPNSSYAIARNTEPENNDTIKELNEIVNALQKIAIVYREHKSKHNQARWKFTGTLCFYIFDNHPINSVFWAKKHDSRDILFVGYLFTKVNGRFCPSVEFIGENEVRDQCEKHLAAISHHSRLLFKWNHDGPHYFPEALNPAPQSQAHT